MKNLMKEAHKMTKEIKKEFPEVDYKTQLGICISYLAKESEENGMVKLQGSEKQVKWAEDIRKDFLKLFNDYKERVNLINVQNLVQTNLNEIVEYYGMKKIEKVAENIDTDKEFYDFYMSFLNDLENELKNNINDSKFYIDNRLYFGFDIIKFIVEEVRE